MTAYSGRRIANFTPAKSALVCPAGVPHVCNGQCIMATTPHGHMEQHWCQTCTQFEKMKEVGRIR